MKRDSRALLGLSLSIALPAVGVAAAYFAVLAILFPHSGRIVLGLLLLEATLLVGLTSVAPTWPRRRWARGALAGLVITSTLPHAAPSALGWLALEPSVELAMYAAHAGVLAFAMGCASRLARPVEAPPRTLVRRGLVVVGAGCVGATVLVIAHSVTFAMARDRDAVLAACEGLAPGGARVEEVRAAARREHLVLPRHGVPEHGSTWMARELIGVRGWQCSLRLEDGAVTSAHADWLVLD